jgi:hypothetical protein
MADPLAHVLRLVADGRLTAEEAEPLLAALSADEPVADEHSSEASASGAESFARQVGRVARIQVTEGGRPSVDLRVPLALGRMGLSSIPGLAGPHADRLRQAIAEGITGPVLEVSDEDGDGVRIVIE